MLTEFFHQLFDYIGKIGVSFTVVAPIAMLLRESTNINAIFLVIFGIFLILISSIFLPMTKKE